MEDNEGVDLLSDSSGEEGSSSPILLEVLVNGPSTLIEGSKV